MQDSPVHPFLVLSLVFAFLFIAGCSGTNAGTAPASLSSTPAQGEVTPALTGGSGGGVVAGTPPQVVVKNTGTSEVHVWIAHDAVSWGGNHGNIAAPGGSISLSVPPDDPSATSPQVVCIGKSEKVLTCREITPATIPVSGTLVWDGTALNPAS